MRNLKSTALFFAVILCVSSLLQAGTNKYGVGDVRKLTLTAPTRVDDVLLPAGDYEVRHVMEAENHIIMVFTQLGTNKPAQTRVKCNLVQLKEKVNGNQVIYESNGASERVRVLRFRGDQAEPVF
jgi:hypothetical protein